MKPPAPGPVSVLSATHETKAAAMQASTALPPSASTWAPASAVSGCPAAMAPRIPQGYSRQPDILARAARLRPGRARLPAHALPRRRVRPLEQLLVRRALQLRHLQRPLLPARRPAGDPAAGGGDRLDGRAGLRGDRLAAVGPDGALVEPHVRRRLVRDRLLRCVPLRARRGPRAAGDLGAAGEAVVALRRAGRADARRQPARVLAVDLAAGRLRDRALGRPAGAARARADGRRVRVARGRALASVPRLGPLSLLVAGAAVRARLLHARHRAPLGRRAGGAAVVDVRRLPRGRARRVRDP